MLSDFRFALRLLGKHKGFTALAVLVLALGIGANSAMFGLINNLLLKPRQGQMTGALVSLYNRDATKPNSYRAFSFATFTELRARRDVFSSLSAHNMAMVGLKEGDVTRRLFVDIVTSEFFATFGVSPVIGRGFTAEEERPDADVPVAVVSYAMWQRLGGSPQVIGQTITLNNRAFTVVGVAPKGFGGSVVMFTPDAFVPTGVYDSLSNDFAREGAARRLSNPSHFNLFLAGQLRPGVTLEQAAPAFKAISVQMAAADPANLKDREVTAGALSRFSISTSPSDDSQLFPVVALLLGMSFVVLLIASFNLANMLLARNGARAKEFAVRMAIGGSRARVIRQLMIEGLVLSLLGGAGGLLLASSATGLMMAALRPLVPVSLTFEATPDIRVVVATFLFCVASTIVFSLGPALRLARTNLVPELKEQSGEMARRSRFAMRDVLVMAQLALSLLMLTVASLFVRGAVQAARTDPGYTFDRGILINVDANLAGRAPEQTRALYQQVQDHLRAAPGVAASSFGSLMAFGDIVESQGVQKPGAPLPAAELVDAIWTSVGTRYFDALGLSLTRGRDFSEAEVFAADSPHVVIIDEPLAERLFGHDEAVGQQIQYSGRGPEPPVVLLVVGVAPGLRQDLFDRGPVPHIYTPFSHSIRSNVYFHVRTSFAGPSAVAAEMAMLPQLGQTLRSLDASLPIFTIETRAQYADRNFLLAILRVGAAIFGVFGAVALLLASIGVYGVKAYIVSRRTREIGIRMALGATPRSVVALVAKEGMLLSGAGLVLGLGLSAITAAALRGLLYQANAIDPLSLSAAFAILFLSALAASWVPARRATRVAPITALRND